jgi:hypothetical protein
MVEFVSEESVDKFGHAGASPKTILPTVSIGSLHELLLKVFKLFGGQAGRRARMRLGGQAVREIPVKSEPAVHGRRG